jgi:hypothetical protein
MSFFKFALLVQEFLDSPSVSDKRKLEYLRDQFFADVENGETLASSNEHRRLCVNRVYKSVSAFLISIICAAAPTPAAGSNNLDAAGDRTRTVRQACRLLQALHLRILDSVCVDSEWTECFQRAVATDEQQQHHIGQSKKVATSSAVPTPAPVSVPIARPSLIVASDNNNHTNQGEPKNVSVSVRSSNKHTGRGHRSLLSRSTRPQQPSNKYVLFDLVASSK